MLQTGAVWLSTRRPPQHLVRILAAVFAVTSRWLAPAGVALAVALGLAVLFWIVRRSSRRLGAPIRSFSVMYVFYLIAVFLPQFSLPRLLMPLSPLLGADAFTSASAGASPG